MLSKRIQRSKGRLSSRQAIILGFISLFLYSPAYAEQLTHCHDGDTCWVKTSDGSPYKVRLYGVDAPEKDQPYGPEATAYMNHMLQGQEVKVICRGRSDDRRTCDLFFNGQDVSGLLVKEGFAWDYPEYSKGKYTALQQEARTHKRGLWHPPDQSSPYCWRWLGTPQCNANPQYQP